MINCLLSVGMQPFCLLSVFTPSLSCVTVGLGFACRTRFPGVCAQVLGNQSYFLPYTHSLVVCNDLCPVQRSIFIPRGVWGRKFNAPGQTALQLLGVFGLKQRCADRERLESMWLCAFESLSRCFDVVRRPTLLGQTHLVTPWWSWFMKFTFFSVLQPTCFCAVSSL